jgi:5'-nucleotidase
VLRRLVVLVFLSAVTGTAVVGEAAASAAPAHKPATLRILVTNDDGVGAPGIAILVEALLDLPRVKVIVVAPAGEQSGTSDQMTPGAPETLVADEAETAGGYPATAVDGFPADSVVYGLDEVVAKPPHLVVSGINAGQNLGPALDLSGTVGAARTAARAGVPALAVSQGLADEPDYPEGADLAIDWIKEHRKRLVQGKVATDEIANLNVPTCTTGSVRGVVEVPAQPTGELLPASDCTSTLEDPPDDVVAFQNGFAPLSEVPAD